MNKIIKFLAVFGLTLTFFQSSLVQASDDRQVISIGTSTVSNDVLEVAQKVFNETNEDYVLEIIVFDDAITPNLATEDGSIDGTFHQYETYMDNFNKDRGTELLAYGPHIFSFKLGIYSDKISDFSEIESGSTVGIANDPVNRGLHLSFLAKEGIITLKEGVEVPGLLDIVENPHNLQFLEIERLGLGNAISDVAFVVAQADVVKQAGRDHNDDLAFDPGIGIVLTIKEEQPWNDALVEALTSDQVRTYIEEETDGTKFVLFGEGE